jgi:hypothetical protein
MLRTLWRLFTPSPRVRRHGPITQELVSQCVERIAAPMAEKLGEIVAKCETNGRIERLELIIRPEFAASRVPVSTHAYARGRVAMDDVEWSWEDLLSDQGTLLPPIYNDVPIGRDDIAGLDFTPEYSCIEATIIAKVREIWTELGKRCPPRLDVFIGTAFFGHGANATDHFSLLNLKSGLWEQLECRGDD